MAIPLPNALLLLPSTIPQQRDDSGLAQNVAVIVPGGEWGRS